MPNIGLSVLSLACYVKNLFLPYSDNDGAIQLVHPPIVISALLFAA